MKHTPEVTTALAIVAESLATSIDFKEMTSDQKRAVFHHWLNHINRRKNNGRAD